MGPIVGIGELLWDVYPDGRKVAGGAPFNFAFHCHQLGHEAVIVSRVGNDELGRELREEVKRVGMSDEYIQTDEEHATGTVRVTLSDNGQPSYRIVDNVAWDYLTWLPKLTLLQEFAKVVVFGTLAQRHFGSEETIFRFVSGHLGWKVLDINHRETNYFGGSCRANYQYCDWFKVNEVELVQLILGYRRDPSSAAPDIRELHYLFGKTLIVTNGRKGCEVFDRLPDGETCVEYGVPANVIDTVGAGDAFTAAMVVMHLEGRPLRECARFANHYAARVCEHRGATPKIDRREVELAAFGKSG